MTSTNSITLRSTTKNEVFAEVEDYIKSVGLKVTDKDSSRPWGGFFKIDESQADAFIKMFFADQKSKDIRQKGNKLSPKILVVEPEKRLSWQYHHRRAEVWKVIYGKINVLTSMTNDGAETSTLSLGGTVFLKQGERHRIVGRSNWSLVAEIWQHVDEDHPSDEDDIVRLEDDFGR